MADIDEKLDNLTKLVEGLSTEVSALRQKVNGEKPPEKGAEAASNGADKPSEVDFAELALLPFIGLMSLAPMAGLGGARLLPAGLRIGASRALLFSRALEHAANVTNELAKVPAGTAATAATTEMMEQFFKGISSQKPDDRRALAELFARSWRAARG